jgi:hypothetical protein
MINLWHVHYADSNSPLKAIFNFSTVFAVFCLSDSRKDATLHAVNVKSAVVVRAQRLPVIAHCLPFKTSWKYLPAVLVAKASLRLDAAAKKMPGYVLNSSLLMPSFVLLTRFYNLLWTSIFIITQLMLLPVRPDLHARKQR